MGAARTHSCHCLSSLPFHPSTPALPLSSPLSSCRSPLHHFQSKVSAHKTDSPHLNHPQLSRQIIHHSAECFLCISPLVSPLIILSSIFPPGKKSCFSPPTTLILPFSLPRPCQIFLSLYPGHPPFSPLYLGLMHTTL